MVNTTTIIADKCAILVVQISTAKPENPYIQIGTNYCPDSSPYSIAVARRAGLTNFVQIV
jgi:CO dehydrogenase/acetyl-CoA synthase alpha subunit|tara:strand:- start:266 stop:445 length:180 start_codon:yes stop_codon:yes gene_type:complete